MKKTHLRIIGVDYRDMGQTDFEYYNQAACGYGRDNVAWDVDEVDCFTVRGKKNILTQR